jgi:adenosylcobinamide-GDP ribazoletransferase
MLSDLANAFSFLTILPVSWSRPRTDRAPGYAFSFYPLVGLVIGSLISLVAAIAIRFVPADVTAFLTLAAWVALTGGLHLDGFADSCDGLLATVSPERRLEIMKDPRAGSWAVVGVALLLLGKWVALRYVSFPMLLLAPVAGRWAMLFAVALFPNARPGGIGAYFRTGLGPVQMIVATVIALAVAIALGWRAIIAMVVSCIIALLFSMWAAKRLGGGLTGDTYGATCELAELTCLILLV